MRGRQSAAIVVVPAEGEWWQTVVALRVEDHPEPLGRTAAAGRVARRVPAGRRGRRARHRGTA
ncbi:MAG: hypothetical protein ACYC91_02245 [Solirubrobacteraceae bacterium]